MERIKGQKVVRSMQAVADCGVNFAEIAEEIGLDKGDMSRAKKCGVLADWHMDSIRKSVRKRGLRYVRASIDSEINLDGLKLSVVAEKLGISQQALSKFVRHPELMPEPRRKQLLKALREIGETLIKVSKGD